MEVRMKGMRFAMVVFLSLSMFLCASGVWAAESTIKPVQNIGAWLIGFHADKANPSRQWVAHHFCHQLRPDLMQCVLYDDNSPDAKMTGIEYIIPGEAFDQLSEDEQHYWHPHNFEILSGQLTLPAAKNELKVMEQKLNSYGKTIHVWKAGVYGQEDETFPLGEPRLAWSFNHLHEPQQGLLESVYESLDISVEQKRKERKALVSQAKAQCGVNAIAGEFKGESKPLEGVKAKEGCE